MMVPPSKPTYQFRFKTTYANPNTFLYNTGQVTSLTDPNLNRRQTYTVTEVKGSASAAIGQNLPTAPAYVGALRSTPILISYKWLEALAGMMKLRPTATAMPMAGMVLTLLRRWTIVRFMDSFRGYRID